MKFFQFIYISVILCAIQFQGTFAEEGMFPFDAVPRAEIKQKYGFEITDAWLRRAQLASVRFNVGGSGSFVSPHGLVMTNHHIASDTLQKLSTPENDLMKNGFLARTQAEELQGPDLELNVLASMKDVTAQVNDAVKPGMSADASAAARRGAIAAIERDATKSSGLRSDVVTLYRGAQYYLYQYKTYRDVRLVFAPEFAIAGFGGDPDNFTYPRFDLDAAFYRVYENGKPLETPEYLKWSKSGANNGEVLFVSGHPGSTSRLDSVAHLEFLRDVDFPLVVKMLTQQRAMLQGYGKKGEEFARRAKEQLLDVENSLKDLVGELDGLRSPALMNRKLTEENEFRARHAAEFKDNDPYAAIAGARKKHATYFVEEKLVADGGGFNSTLYEYAMTLVRLANENQKPDGERDPEYSDARRPQLEAELFSPTPVFEDLEVLKFANSIKLMQEELGDQNPIVKRVLDDATPALVSVNLIQKSKLGDVEFRKALAKGGQKAIADSKDPLIVLARGIEPRARELQKAFEADVESIERNAYARIAKARLADARGTGYPDATFTLRLSYGEVKGYTSNKIELDPHTTYAGLYKRADEHPKDKDYELPPRWLDAAKKAALPLDTPFNFVSTHDIAGGNSGSPVFNKEEEIVGLIFDGNIESLVGDFIYDETTNRAVSVDSRGIIEALDKMYDAKELVQELKGGS